MHCFSFLNVFSGVEPPQESPQEVSPFASLRIAWTGPQWVDD